jgi:1-deoxy-D-xylulose-5-phosphate reductoisomerase
MTDPSGDPLNDLDLAPVLGRRLTVLGSTGSVGTATLDVVRFARSHYGSGAFPLQGLTAQRNVDLLVAQALEFRPRLAVIGDAALKNALGDALAGTGIRVAAGPAGILEAAQQPSEMVMSAIVGAAGLAPTLAAVERGAIVALANKECVVAAGEVFRRAAEDSRGVLIPVDSEHNAAFQLLDFAQAHAIEKVTLTASGGPFRTWPLDRMATASPEQAVSHPNWSMGAKISVDSATLMNKGLELIEAHILFGLAPEKLDVVIHAQSMVPCWRICPHPICGRPSPTLWVGRGAWLLRRGA